MKFKFDDFIIAIYTDKSIFIQNTKNYSIYGTAKFKQGKFTWAYTQKMSTAMRKSIENPIIKYYNNRVFQ